MHPEFHRAETLTRAVIGAAIEVHKIIGSGVMESIYEKCLMRELQIQNLKCVNQKAVQIRYKDLVFDEQLRFDILVEDCLLLELKTVTEILPVHKAQLLSYMKLLNIPVGLILNFHEIKITDGVHRMFLPGNKTMGTII
jgi:GxxExxY protein